MRRARISYVPLILGIVGMLAMVALVQDRNVRTWSVVLGLTTVAAVSYAAYQEHLATRAVTVARRRLGGSPFDELRREMDRARRHERPFALARITPHPSGEVTARMLLERLRSNGDRPELRSADRFWRSGGDYFLLLPETSSQAARAVVERAVTAADQTLDADWQVVAFPEDGLTSTALFQGLGAPPPRAEELPAAGRSQRRPRVKADHPVPVRQEADARVTVAHRDDS